MQGTIIGLFSLARGPGPKTFRIIAVKSYSLSGPF